jgi:hypothetical protein
MGHLCGNSRTVIGNYFPECILWQSHQNGVGVRFFDHPSQNLSIYLGYICECMVVDISTDSQHHHHPRLLVDEESESAEKEMGGKEGQLFIN